MFDIGFWELVVIAVVALVVVGPEKLPKLARVCGLWIGRANASLQAVKKDIAKELRAEELQQALKKAQDLPDINKIADLDQADTSNTKLEDILSEKSVENKQADDEKR